jgi:hypothetical protein
MLRKVYKYIILHNKMYNTDFKVKYHDIEEELICKFKNKTQTEYVENPNEEYEYSNQDIIDICDKIYRDELLSVFNADTIIDNKIDGGLEYAKTILLNNDDIKTKINGLIEFFLNEKLHMQETDTHSEHNTVDDNRQYIESAIFISLFSQPIFYITHQCVCQQFHNNNIDANLLIELLKFLDDNN